MLSEAGMEERSHRIPKIYGVTWPMKVKNRPFQTIPKASILGSVFGRQIKLPLGRSPWVAESSQPHPISPTIQRLDAFLNYPKFDSQHGPRGKNPPIPDEFDNVKEAKPRLVLKWMENAIRWDMIVAVKDSSAALTHWNTSNKVAPYIGAR